jgi:tRNA U38,U39,U40 pseudouridine synthase TruA
VRAALDVAAMNEAAQVLVGEHDFSSFRAVECQSPTAKRHVDEMHRGIVPPRLGDRRRQWHRTRAR